MKTTGKTFNYYYRTVNMKPCLGSGNPKTSRAMVWEIRGSHRPKSKVELLSNKHETFAAKFVIFLRQQKLSAF